ncbi:MAG: cupin-like domain-containing protein [Pseudomonadota bacterium]
MPTIDWDRKTPVRVWENVDAALFRDAIQPWNEPAILRGLVSHRPAAQAARESSRALTDYLRRFDAGRPVQAFFGAPEIRGRFFYGADLRSFNFERRDVPLPRFLDLMHEHEASSEPPYFYAGAIPVPSHLPALPGEIRHGLLDEGVEQLASVWLGNRTRTAAHFDLPQNIACVIGGRRRFIVLPIEQLPNLYVGPLDFTLAGQAISLVDFLEPDLDRHPRFADAIDAAQVAVLEPGDALYLPSLWWHHVEALDPVGAMVNFWWRDGPEYLFTPLLTLFHALLSLRDMPAREREAWRVLFDHYIFQVNGDPWAHVPEAARGLFGELTPEKIQRLRQQLGQSLLGRPPAQ